MNPADKAWITRRANGTAPMAKNTAAPDVRNPDIALIMSISLGQTDGLSEIACSFRFMHQTKPAELSALSMEDRALLSIKLVTRATATDATATLAGHDRMTCTIIDGHVSDLESILPRLRHLDSVLVTTMADSEDSSFAMALQAIAWNLRIDLLEYDGKRTKRGVAYSIGEQIAESVIGLYADKA